MSHSRFGTITVPVLLAVMAALPRLSGAAGLDLAVDISGGNLRVLEQAPALPPRPDCRGPLSILEPAVISINLGAVPSNLMLTATLDPGLTAIPGSCVATGGTCQIVNASTITWNVTVAGNSQESIVYKVRIDADVAINTELCINYDFTVDSMGPVSIKACTTTNSADICAIGAPLLGGRGQAALVLMLMAAGAFTLLRRRRA